MTGCYLLLAMMSSSPAAVDNFTDNTDSQGRQWKGETSGSAITDNSQGSARHTVSELPAETLDFAARVFDLARAGDEQTLRAYLDAGLPANLTNDRGAVSSSVSASFNIRLTRSHFVLVFLLGHSMDRLEFATE